jgi:GAF domain-containing protein
MLENVANQAVSAIENARLYENIQKVYLSTIEVLASDTMLFEQLRMQFYNITALRLQTDYVNSAGQGLQLDIGTDSFSERVHHVEGVFVAIKE